MGGWTLHDCPCSCTGSSEKKAVSVLSTATPYFSNASKVKTNFYSFIHSFVHLANIHYILTYTQCKRLASWGYRKALYKVSALRKDSSQKKKKDSTQRGKYFNKSVLRMLGEPRGRQAKLRKKRHGASFTKMVMFRLILVIWMCFCQIRR